MTDQPAAEARPRPPGTVLAVACMLVIGGLQTTLQGILGATRAAGSAGFTIAYGLLYLGLAWAVLRGHRWARVTLLVLCGVGLLLAAAQIIFGQPALGLITAVWTIAYLFLIRTRSAHAWFTR